MIVTIVREAAWDLAAQRMRAVLGVICLSGIVVFVLVVQLNAQDSRRDLAELLARPEASVIRLKAYQSDLTIDPAVVEVALHFEGVRDGLGMSEPVSVSNALLPPGRSAVVRGVTNLPAGMHASVGMACGQGLALPDANRSLGLKDGVGTANLDGTPISIVGERPAPAGLSFLSTSVLVPSCDDASIKELVVVADEPRIVPHLISALLSLFTTDERSRLQLESDVDEIADSEAVALAAERSAQSTSMTGTAGATGATALLLAAMVVQRRRDFGRRRALGATRAWVSALIVVQAWIMALTASCLAVAAMVAVSAVSDVTTPDASFVAGLGLMLVCAAPVGGLVAGSLAATGDPLREIRVP